MKWRQRLRALMQLAQICHWQSLLLQAKDLQIEQLKVQLAHAELKAQRSYLDLVMLIQEALESCDPEIFDKLEAVICDVADHVARLEEHVT